MLEEIKTRFEMQALLGNYPYFQQILQNIKQVIWIVDLNTDQILYVNVRLSRSFGGVLVKAFMQTHRF